MFTQWSHHEGTFTPVGDTSGSIEPGYYNLTHDQSGHVYFEPVRSRVDTLLKFPDSASQAVVQNISDFWDREATFERYDLPFKRSILLYGPAGSGKTCTLELISRDVIARGGIVIEWPGDVTLLINGYRALRDIQPNVPIVVLMEDFDEILKHTAESRMLNLLDGVERLDKIVFLATTNYPELLQERIINRPSRFDVRVLIGPPCAETRAIYLKSLLREGDEIDIPRYVKDTHNLSLAHVKELFVATHILGVPYASVVQNLRAMQDENPSSQDESYREVLTPFGMVQVDRDGFLTESDVAINNRRTGGYL